MDAADDCVCVDVTVDVVAEAEAGPVGGAGGGGGGYVDDPVDAGTEQCGWVLCVLLAVGLGISKTSSSP